ncbi:MAG: hypothetical protein II921_07350 [Treponema sp.]|nr:hypothetical protein [Treponema sp.]
MKNKQNLVSKSSILTLFAVILFSLTVRLLCASEIIHTDSSEPPKTAQTKEVSVHV